MKAVFLCGGVGKRMFPITEDKFLLDFLGKTLLEHQILMAKKAGLRSFVIIGNPVNIEQIRRIAAGIKGVKFEFALQKKPLGIADALRSAASSLGDEILVVNPNDVFDPLAYGVLLGAPGNCAASSFMLGYRVKQYFPGGYLAVKSNGQLKRIVEKPEPGTEPSDLVNILLHLHRDAGRLLTYMNYIKTSLDDVYECTMDQMVKDGYKIKVTAYDGFWAPIKYPWHLFDVVRFFLDKSVNSIAKSAQISGRATIEGKAVIGENVRVLENAVIRGPAYIGPNTVIGNNALIRDYSHIGANCVVGFSTEIKNSYVGDNCWFHSSYIGDSIVGDNCSFAAGSVTANFRFDQGEISVKYNGKAIGTGRNHFGAIIGDDCRTGINSGILPGRRVGPNSIVGSNVCLTEDLKPNTIVFNKTRCEFTENTARSGQPPKARIKRKKGNAGHR